MNVSSKNERVFGVSSIIEPNIEKGRRVLVTSDIHGHVEYLKNVLARANFSTDDVLIINGDLTEKGPASLECIRYVLELMRELRALSEADISMFVTVGAHHYYYGMLSTYFNELIPDSSELINKFFECEIYYIYYLRDANEENLETFKTKLEAALSAYEGAKDNATVAEYFGEMLEYYSEKLAEIEAERTPTGDSTEDAQ